MTIRCSGQLIGNRRITRSRQLTRSRAVIGQAIKRATLENEKKLKTKATAMVRSVPAVTAKGWL